MSEHPLTPAALQHQRQLTVDRLCESFAQDRIDLVEFESRLDAANRVGTAAELAALVQDLPVPAATPPSTTRTTLERGGRMMREAVRDSRTLVAFMGGVERRGHWTPARRNVLIAVMGGVVLDFREVELPAGVTEVYVFCCMGGAEIIVPEGLAVDASGIAIMGGFEHASAPPGALGPDAPVLRINGVCIMGGAEIKVMRPGETEKEARIRKRGERKALRDRNRDTSE